MAKFIATQWLFLLAMTGIFYWQSGLEAALSTALGGSAYAVPTAVAILFLKILAAYPNTNGIAFFGSESLKIILSLICLIGSFLAYPKIQFLPFLIGLLTVTHLSFLFFLKVYHYGSK